MLEKLDLGVNSSQMTSSERLFPDPQRPGRYSGRVFMADQEEVNKICEDYQKLENKYDIFERMFIQLFLEEEIELSVHFGLDKLKEEDLRKDQRFRTHVGKFQRFFTGIVEMLSKGPEQLSNIVQVLRKTSDLLRTDKGVEMAQLNEKY
ncbi:hypothetical protein COOONC_23027 [Cooperia oncophora]